MSERVVLPEWLDVLPAKDARAHRSRRDLRRLNGWMGHPQIMARALNEHYSAHGGRRLVELGAGDGHFLLQVAKLAPIPGPLVEALLVDRLDVLDPQIWEQFERLGWRARGEIQEAGAWLRRSPTGERQSIISNLFLHQFETGQLRQILRLAADVCGLFVALEPRRGWLPRLCGGCLWMIGCGPVTQHDASISIRAGFRDGELSSLWPDADKWELTEGTAGWFSHLFIARRKG